MNISSNTSDNQDKFAKEKIVYRCFKYCIREFISEHLAEYEKECLNTCKQKSVDQYQYFNDKSMAAFK